MTRARQIVGGLLVSVIGATGVSAAELELRIDNPPTNAMVVLLFDSADTFVDLREPLRRVVLPAGANAPVRLTDLPAGEFAVVVYEDSNGNGRLDKNFVGIPREPLGFSNRYWPQGPPSFARAAVPLGATETNTQVLRLQSVFGPRGLVGVGAGLILQTSPYRGADALRAQPIPVLSYIGERVQLLGPAAQVGLAGGSDLRLAATASYRVGAYEEDDSPALDGLGNRDDTLMGGLAVQAELTAGLELSAGYEHDLLDRTGGGQGRLGLARDFQRGPLTLSPQLALSWLTAELADYEYGVRAAEATADRPAYRPGDAVNLELGLNLFVELSGAWRILVNGSVTFLDRALTESPLVDESQVFGSFMAITRLL